MYLRGGGGGVGQGEQMMSLSEISTGVGGGKCPPKNKHWVGGANVRTRNKLGGGEGVEMGSGCVFNWG